MYFTIITTTFKRPNQLLRAILSVQNQKSCFTHYIVNDSPDFDYAEVESVLTKYQNIVYIKNKENIGKNRSLNKILDILEKESFDGFVVYLDDDDWLSPTCLSDFKTETEHNKDSAWFVSNRTLEDGASLTKNKIGKNKINYIWDYLILKRFTGDATHCIDFQKTKYVRFPKSIKNGEEWIYFAQIAKKYPSFLYKNSTGTVTKGYQSDGITKKYQTPRTKLLLEEVSRVDTPKLITILYILLRKIKAIVK